MRVRKEKWRLREMESMKIPQSAELIRSDPSVMMGKPVITGTRITVELILEKLAAGETIPHILRAHPQLTETSIRAALDFASKAIRADVVYPVVHKRK